MANASAVKEAPSKASSNKWELEDSYWNQETKQLGPTMDLDPTMVYMFHLAEENLVRELPVMDARTNRPIIHQKFKPWQNIVYTSQIVWKGQRAMLRYYDGCTSIFVQDQPEDKYVIDELIKQTQRREFLHGKFGANGDEKMLLLYLYICGWNAESPFRTRIATPIFVPKNSMKAALAKDKDIDQMLEAVQVARDATDKKMKIHGNYLGLPVLDYDSGNPLTDVEIRLAYKEEAAKNPANFLKTYGDSSIEVRYYIDKALADRVINNKHNPNRATWGKNNSEICDISGLRTTEAIGDRIFEFAQSEAGQEFLIQLKQLYN